MNSRKRGRQESLINECLYIRQLKDISSFVGCIYAINSEYTLLIQNTRQWVGPSSQEQSKTAQLFGTGDKNGCTKIFRN